MAVQRLRRRGGHQQLGASRYDLRRRRLILADIPHELVVPDDTAATLRDLQLLDTDSERLVFRMRAHRDGAVLAATDDELDELIGFVADEANHEPHRRRRRRLDAAVDALSGGWVPDTG